MSKVIRSPVKQYAGTVTLADPLTFPQVFAVQDAIDAAAELGDKVPVMRYHHAILPGILACVEEWELDNFPENPTPDNIPATPARASAELIAWLMNEVSALFAEVEPDPKE